METMRKNSERSNYKKQIFNFQKRISINHKIKIITNSRIADRHQDLKYQGGIYNPERDLRAKILDAIIRRRECF